MDALEQLRANLTALHRQVLRSVEDLSDDEINRQPEGLDNTIGILMRHLVGSERHYVGGVIGGTGYARDRDAEFGREPLRKADLVAMMREAGDESDRVLRAASPGVLAEEFDLTLGGQPARRTKWWALGHTLEHYGYHHGQIRVYRRLVRR